MRVLRSAMHLRGTSVIGIFQRLQNYNPAAVFQPE